MRIKIILRIGAIQALSNLLKFFWIFPLQRNRALFMSYNGKQFSDSPKAVFDEMVRQNLPFEKIWAFADPSNIKQVKELQWVKVGTVKYLYYFCTSKYIIVNDTFNTFLPIRKSQVVINTWHGGGWFKKVGLSSNTPSDYDKWFFKTMCKKHTYYVASSEYFVDTVLNQSFGYKGNILRTGMPRNAELFQKDDSLRKKVRQQFSDNQSDMIVLYAPTYRTYKDNIPAIDLSNLSDALHERYKRNVVFLYRAHHLIESFPIDGDRIVNVTDYPNMQELLLACDVLVSDYSSCMWEGALLRKLIIVYAPDAQKYISTQGFFLDIHKWPGLICFTNDDVKTNVLNFNEEEYNKKVDRLVAETTPYEGPDSTQAILNVMNCQ